MLIVEHDPYASQECATALRHLGYAPLISNSPTEALDLFARHPFSVAFVGYQLPNRDGLSLIQVLSRTAGTQKRPTNVVMMDPHTIHCTDEGGAAKRL